MSDAPSAAVRKGVWYDLQFKRELMTDSSSPNDQRANFPFRFADRYEVRGLLGRGGMASVYRAWDEVLGCAVALKVLAAPADLNHAARTVELFEREFHTLAHLSHPRIVRAHDYGLLGEEPYYCMELLDGGDLRELAPLPWQDVCTVAYEICSALSLLHSRRLVHRDLTPRNVRRTQSGQSKLIDFGLLSPMGPTTLLAGTPPFVAPELVRTLSLDGRGDLFSLGATLYYALTKRHAFSALTFDQLQDAWRGSPTRPSAIVPGVPAALDDLLLGMLRVDPGSRPKSAAEVMERLVPLLSSPPDDELRAARAYLSTPKLVGRDDAVAQFRKATMRAVRGRGGGFAVVGDEGTGRSRMLDAFVLEAKLVGATAVRAGHADAVRPFGVAASIVRQIHRAAPAVAVDAAAADPAVAALLYPVVRSADADALRDPIVDATEPGHDRATLHAALRTFVLEFSKRRPLAIAVDDLDRIDEPSAALVASLTLEAPVRRLVYAAALSRRDEAADAVGILRKHAEEVVLSPLTSEQVSALFASLFGEVPNLKRLAGRMAELSAGRPRECMTFAQYLVDENQITYAGGSWTLPAEIPERILPASLEEASARRIAQLGPVARQVATMLGENLVDRLSRADLLRAELAPASQLDAGVDELLAARFLLGDPSGYALTGAGVSRLLSASLSGDERCRIHDQLFALHDAAGRHLLLVCHHGLAGSNPGVALERLLSQTTTSEARTDLVLSSTLALGTLRVAHVLDSALAAAERHGRSPRDLQALWVMLAGICAHGADLPSYYRIRPAWLSQLKKDSGFDDWQGLDASLPPSTRTMMAIGAAAQRYAGTPEAERVLSPQEAIQQLVSYVVFAIAISSRTLDLELKRSLPELLVPFAPLNPMIAAMSSNAQATFLFGQRKLEAAREKFVEVLSRLDDVAGAELRYVDKVRAAVIYALASIDVSLGVPSDWLERCAADHDVNQRVGACFLKTVAALQHGDSGGAEAHRQRGELLALQTNATSMFTTLQEELAVHASARDLTCVRQVRASVRSTAERQPGWLPVTHVADGYYLRLCGDLEGALAAADRAVSSGDDGEVRSGWVICGRILAVEVLTELGRAEEAMAIGLTEIARCEAVGMRSFVRDMSRAVALSEAKLGRHAAAFSRVEAVVEEQKAAGVTGLQLGLSYEALARVALGAADGESFRRFAALAREQFGAHRSSAFGALHERLMDEGRQAGLVDLQSRVTLDGKYADTTAASSPEITHLMAGCANGRERAERALGLLCDGEPPTRGHLLLYTSAGLSVVASNTACDSVTELVSFAKDCLERESRADTMETGALLTVPLGTMSADWHDARGTAYDVVLLGATISGTFCIGGVALLMKIGGQSTRIQSSLAEMLARALINSGDATTVVAA